MDWTMTQILGVHPVIKNLPWNAGDTGSIPGQSLLRELRFHMLWSKYKGHDYRIYGPQQRIPHDAVKISSAVIKTRSSQINT